MVRSDKYLAYIRSQACCECYHRGDVVAHHHGKGGGTGEKTHDTMTVPLCNEHHTEFHQKGTLGILDRIMLDAYFSRKQIELLTAYLEQEGIEL